MHGDALLKLGEALLTHGDAPLVKCKTKGKHFVLQP